MVRQNHSNEDVTRPGADSESAGVQVGRSGKEIVEWRAPGVPVLSQKGQLGEVGLMRSDDAAHDRRPSTPTTDSELGHCAEPVG